MTERKKEDRGQRTGENLCIDIGNTRYKIAVFKADQLLSHSIALESELGSVLEEVFHHHPIQNMIVSSTRKGVNEVIKNKGKQLKTYIELKDSTALPIEIDYLTPETLGRDRIAAAVGADCLFPDEGNIVIDAGTCITCDFVDAGGKFLGGNISPGIQMRIRAMHEHTDNLPLVEAKNPPHMLGKTTEEALQNGAIKGTIYEIDSFIRVTSEKYGKSKVILTGGDAKYFVDYFKTKIFVVQNLVLIGLNKILQHNAQ
jgi:type III pantothenate kinase